MTKANLQPAIKEQAINSVAGHLEELTGTLEKRINIWAKRIEAQARLLNTCRSEEEIKRLEAQGLLDFEGPSL